MIKKEGIERFKAAGIPEKVLSKVRHRVRPVSRFVI